MCAYVYINVYKRVVVEIYMSMYIVFMIRVMRHVYANNFMVNISCAHVKLFIHKCIRRKLFI